MFKKFNPYHIIDIFILVTPAVLYFSLVDFGMWDKAEHWGELGTALGGMYSPILTIYMILILASQSQIQKRQTNIQERQLRTQDESSKHQFDSYILKHMESKFLKSLSDLEQVIIHGKKTDVELDSKILLISSFVDLSEIDGVAIPLAAIALNWRSINSYLHGTNLQDKIYLYHRSYMISELRMRFVESTLVAFDKINVRCKLSKKKECVFWVD